MTKDKRKNRPAWRPSAKDLKKIEELAASGLTQEKISIALGISQPYYWRKKREFPEIGEAIKRGKAKIPDPVNANFIKAVKSGDAWVISFWLKCRGGGNERLGLDLAGQVKVTDSFSALEKAIAKAVKKRDGAN